MLSGEFARNMRRLNKNLRVWCGDDAKRAATLYMVVNGEFVEICGVDKNWVPEHTEFWPNGRIKRGGWRRVLKILVQRKLIDRFYAERIFMTHLEYMKLPPVVLEKDVITRALEDAKRRGKEKAEKKAGCALPDFHKDGRPIDYMDLADMVDIHRMRGKQNG